MTFNIKVDVVNNLPKTNKNIDKAVIKGVERVAIYTEGEVKEGIGGHRPPQPKSFDTGNFMRSVNLRKVNEGTWSVEDGTTYGQYLEYGTSKIPARRHFRQTADNVNKIGYLFVQEEIAKTI